MPRPVTPFGPASPDGVWFRKDLSTPEPISESSIEQTVAWMRTGRLHRCGEQGKGYPEP